MSEMAEMSSDAASQLAEKVEFLSSTHAHGRVPVEAIETHMSWVFLAGDRAFKLKKPVHQPYLDFRSLAARRANCEAEVRLNRRLAPDVYIGTVALTRTEGGLAIGGDGAIVDWLVVMRRLPAENMLDRLQRNGQLNERHVSALAARLAQFYESAERPQVKPEEYSARLIDEQRVNRDILTRRAFAVDHGKIPDILADMDRALAANRPLLERRAADGELVDGHGDLRPEHVCFTDGIVIFDCLEFSDALRLIDPVDEIAFLCMECDVIGGGWIRPLLTREFFAKLGVPCPLQLIELHTARRAILRARLALAHLLDSTPREPAKWEPLAGRYVSVAEAALAVLKSQLN